MQKRNLIAALLLMVCSVAFPQKKLEVEDRSQGTDVYSSEGNEAAVMIRCDRSIPLTFASSMDKSADPFRTELQGSDSVYYIAFPTGNRYRGRVLTVMSPGYEQKDIALDLQPKALLTLAISDPDAIVGKGCYIEHRNKAQLEIKNSNYEQAKDLLEEAVMCSDVDTAENNANLKMVDSLIYYRQMGENAFKLLDYRTAGDYYEKAMMLNPYDNYASNRYSVCAKNYKDECGMIFSRAEFCFNEKDYVKARELYQQVVDKECDNMLMATDRINIIDAYMTAKKDHSRVLTYEYRKDVPVGMSYGKYNMHKVGGFIQFDFNNVVFDALRSECRYGDTKFPELNIAFGWTLKIANPVWVYFGPGFTGKLYYGTYEEDNYPKYKNDAIEDQTDMDEKEIDKANKKSNFAFAVSPVVGICAKYSYFAVRLTYQYRWSIKSELDDFMGTSRLSFGVGVAF